MPIGSGSGTCHTQAVTTFARQSLASKNKWLLVVAVLLVLPGTLLSVAFGGVGLVLLAMLLVDGALVRATASPASRPALGVVAQLGLAGAVAAAVGGSIALLAWVI